MNRIKNTIARIFGGESPSDDGRMEREHRPAERIQTEGNVRRWDSAETTRLNASQWCNVWNVSINTDLVDQLRTLRARCRHAARNNPMVEGLLKTYAIDVMGETGPTLAIESDNSTFNRIFRDDVWLPFWENLEVTGMTGQELLMRLIPQDFTDGDWCQQYIDLSNELPSSEVVTTRLLDLDPDRLDTPYERAGTQRIICGIQRDRLGRPAAYYVLDPRNQFVNSAFDVRHKFEEIPADEFLHSFENVEPGQVRGFPKLASTLQDIADLDDYDKQVLDAARAAASNGFLLTTTVPELTVDAEAGQGSFALERQQARYIKPGYEATQMNPAQPAAHYVDFRHERWRSVGRVCHMPLLMVLLSAEDSNFSQSRIDLNVIYQRGINNYRMNRIEKKFLVPLVNLAYREARLKTTPGRNGTFVLPKAPKRWKATFGWEPMGHANPKDYATSVTMLLEMGLTDLELELQRNGQSLEESIARRQRVNKMLVDAGLEPITGPRKKPQSNAEESSPPETPAKKKRESRRQPVAN